MTPNADALASTYHNFGNNFVTFGNGQSLPISKIDHTCINNKLPLSQVLVVPHLTKILLSISRLTRDSKFFNFQE